MANQLVIVVGVTYTVNLVKSCSYYTCNSYETILVLTILVLFKFGRQMKNCQTTKLKSPPNKLRNGMILMIFDPHMSGKLAQDFQALMMKAQEDTTFTYHKKKGITMEKKEACVQKEEADRYQKLPDDLTKCQLEEQLFRLVP